MSSTSSEVKCFQTIDDVFFFSTNDQSMFCTDHCRTNLRVQGDRVVVFSFALVLSYFTVSNQREYKKHTHTAIDEYFLRQQQRQQRRRTGINSVDNANVDMRSQVTRQQ